MNIAYELSKIRDAFIRVRNDMNFLSQNIMTHYDEHKKNHSLLSEELSKLSDEVRNYIQEHKNSFNSHLSSESKLDYKPEVSKKHLHDLKDSIRDLKKELSHVQKEHLQLIGLVEKIDKSKVDTGDFKELENKYRSTELELHLLKEKLSKKDVEIETLKEVNNKMFSIIDELTNTELELLEATK